MQRNASLSIAIVAATRERKAGTYLRWFKGRDGHQENEEAGRLASLASRKLQHDQVDL